jgi:hypothetical protein
MTRLQEIKSRAEAATPPRWTIGATSIKGESLLMMGDIRGFSDRSIQMETENVDFIANAREDVPWLLEVVEKLDKILREVRQWDMMSEYPGVDGQMHETTGDGRYWRDRIDAVLAAIEDQHAP